MLIYRAAEIEQFPQPGQPKKADFVREESEGRGAIPTSTLFLLNYG